MVNQIIGARGIDQISSALGYLIKGIFGFLHVIPGRSLRGLLGHIEHEGIIFKAAPVIAVRKRKGANIEIGSIGHIKFSVTGVCIAVIDEPGYEDMKNFPQFRMYLKGRIYKGIDFALFGKRDPVNKAYLVSVHRVPFSGPVSVIIRAEGRISRRLCKKHRRNTGLFAYIEMKTRGGLLFYNKVFAPEGQILAKGRKD
jgi:hypothetical protein